MRLKKLIIQAMLASVLVIGFGLTAITSSQAGWYNTKPALTDPAVVYAKETTDILQSRLFAALLQEFNSTTAATAPKATDAISLIFNDKNHNMRLIGTVGPLRQNDYPKDQFEQTAVAQANAQNGAVYEAVDGVPGQWYFRRSVPVSNFSESCKLCHLNYQNLPSTKIVGALALKVPIKNPN
jgi:Protein of unknown function (DUF3365)